LEIREILPGAVIGADGSAMRSEKEVLKFPQAGIVEIGDDVKSGEQHHRSRSLEDTRIAEGAKLDNLVHVGHNCQIGGHNSHCGTAGLSGSCVFGKHVVWAGRRALASAANWRMAR